MKRSGFLPVLLLGLLASSPAFAEDAAANNLMPQPASVSFQPGRLSITGDLTVVVPKYSDDRLQRAITRATRRLSQRTGIDLAQNRSTPAAAFVIEVDRPGETVQSLDEVESYRLHITAQQAMLRAETVAGALRGLETFLQLVTRDRNRYFFPAVTIRDQPRFRWRGLLIDVSRHWQPVEVIKRNLDGMAAVKLNVFHWHLTDDQGFRIESKKYPKLTELGSDGDYYSQDQVREIVAYARDRGIRVVPEFDMPGHVTALVTAYPELASAPGPYSVGHTFGVFDPALDPTREETYEFLDNFLGEMATLFPDAYVHVGGDENNGNQWKSNVSIQSFMKAHGFRDMPAFQSYFTRRVEEILQGHGKKMLVWEEGNISPEGALLETWHRGSDVGNAVRNGRKTLLSTPYYLDQIQPASRLYSAEPLAAELQLTPEQAQLVLGGEACIWSEHVSPETIDSRIWPMLAAVAERLWSPKETNDIADMYRRLDRLSVSLEAFGLRHITHTDVLLRSMTQEEDANTLRKFVGTVRPATFDQRSSSQKLDQFTPLTHFVDAANPDPSYAHRLSNLVDSLLSDAPRFAAHRADLEAEFQRWQVLPGELNTIANANPWVEEVGPRAADLALLGKTGSEALTFLTTGANPPPGWKEAKLAMLDEAFEPKALLRFSVLPSLRELVVAAANVDGLRSYDAVRWKVRVTTEASASAPTNEGYR